MNSKGTTPSDDDHRPRPVLVALSLVIFLLFLATWGVLPYTYPPFGEWLFANDPPGQDLQMLRW